MKKTLLILSFLLVIAVVASCSKGNNVTGGVVVDTPRVPPTEIPAPPVEIEEPQDENEVFEVKITEKGFEPAKLEIAVGDTVRWINVRESQRLKKAFILGTRNCLEIRSEVLMPEETFEWTFDEAETCSIVEGITVNQLGTILVED